MNRSCVTSIKLAAIGKGLVSPIHRVKPEGIRRRNLVSFICDKWKQSVNTRLVGIHRTSGNLLPLMERRMLLNVPSPSRSFATSVQSAIMKGSGLDWNKGVDELQPSLDRVGWFEVLADGMGFVDDGTNWTSLLQLLSAALGVGLGLWLGSTSANAETSQQEAFKLKHCFGCTYPTYSSMDIIRKKAILVKASEKARETSLRNFNTVIIATPKMLNDDIHGRALNGFTAGGNQYCWTNSQYVVVLLRRNGTEWGAVEFNRLYCLVALDTSGHIVHLHGVSASKFSCSNGLIDLPHFDLQKKVLF